MKKRIFDIIQIGDKSNIISCLFDAFLVLTIFLNISAMVMQTFEELASYENIFILIEQITTLIFCVEYVLRIWTADYLYPDKGKGAARLRFLISYDGIVDLLTIIPFFFLSGFIVFRMLRVVRIFHLFRINAQYDSFNVITSVLYEKRNQIASSLFIIGILMLASSLCMYSAEHEAQPENFKNAFSGLWWTSSAILTVGYGDICPVTALGKAMAVCISFLGVGAVAIPTGIISAGFVEQYSRESYNGRRYDMKQIGEIEISQGHDFCNKTPLQILNNCGVNIYLVLRGTMTILPTSELILQSGDIVFVKSETELIKQGRK